MTDLYIPFIIIVTATILQEYYTIVSQLQERTLNFNEDVSPTGCVSLEGIKENKLCLGTF